jgi:hypothetical protein
MRILYGTQKVGDVEVFDRPAGPGTRLLSSFCMAIPRPVRCFEI